ncbi:hypothetical protein AX16_008896 [Volvariella volvacea WC 439]|nr:hypothetical protein AX16_008896 [Volvariella volvacea WC 439]
MPPIKPITSDEFARMIAKCRPQTGWSKTLAVANSGGPDSTCLLFLLHRYLSEKRTQNPAPNPFNLYASRVPALVQPQRVVSLTVDHDLQPSSASMAEQCTKTASGLGMQHITSKIRWGTSPFPPHPSDGDAFEGTARLARYHLILEMMRQTKDGCDIVAFGHHVDDQVETSLMRIGKGTTEIGAGGMRPVRRWGMGYGKGPGDLAWAGYEGLNKWIIRPLLDVSKDRILATCDEHGLEYVIDKTNFQPAATLRNALRSIIHEPDNTPELPSHIKEQVDQIESTLAAQDSVDITLSSGIEQLRGAVQLLSSRAEDIERQVDSSLKRCMLQSPIGTCLVSSRALQTIRDPLVRSGMVLRIMRYVSFHGWGSLRADANRRRSSVQQVIERLWDLDPNSDKSMFVAGGGVLWMPVLVRDGRIKTPDRLKNSGIERGDVIAWLASRQPPLKKRILTERNVDNPLEVDVTQLLAEQLKSTSAIEPIEVLYDCRFLVRFNLGQVSEQVQSELAHALESGWKAQVKTHTRWYWPRVVLIRGEGDLESIRVLHSQILGPERSVMQPTETEDQTTNHHKRYWRPRDRLIDSGWITIDWVRPLS